MSKIKIILKSLKLWYSVTMEIEEIKKLAEMARIDIKEKEAEGLARDFDVILSYVGQVQEAVKNKKIELNEEGNNNRLYNIVRQDEVTNQKGEYAEKIIEQMPDTENGYLKVKQVL